MALKSAYGGLFQDPSFITTDADPAKTDLYDKGEVVPSRYLGKSMLSSPPPASGLRPDVFFEKKFLTLAASDQNDPRIVAEMSKREAREKKRRAAAAAAASVISNKTFMYTSFPQKSTGPGTNFGCFPPLSDESAVYKEQPATRRKNKKKAMEDEAALANGASGKATLPNIKTNPSKKGTYGFPGLLLEKTPYNEQWREELEAYQAAARKKQQQQANRAGKSEPVEKHPFHLSAVSHSFFDELPATGVSGVYTFHADEMDKGGRSQQSHRHRRRDRAAAGQTGKPVVHEKPFSTSLAGRADRGCINPFPNMWLSPEELEKAFGNANKKSRRSGRSTKNDKPGWKMERPKGAGEWIPNSSGKTSIISSCLRRFY